MTQEELANLTGVTREMINSYERGHETNPRLSTLLGLQDALDLASIEELLGHFPSASHSIPGSSAPKKQGAKSRSQKTRR